MNRMIKNVLVATAITITFAPTLHGENPETETPVNKGKLQSAIDYIKNMRTPLTAQEKLAQHIAQADVARFKTAYDAFMQSDVTPAERTTIAQELTASAQEVKQQLQAALDAMGDSQVKKTMLAKGVAQSIGGAALITSEACLATMLYKHRPSNPVEFNDNVFIAMCEVFGMISTLPVIYASSKIFKANPWGKKGSVIFALLANTALGAYGLKSGIQNCKNGWNYKAYLQEQIKNIDEIIEHITAKQQ